MENITIGPASESDLASIRQLLGELLDAMEDTEGLDLEQAVENCRRMLGNPNSCMLIARERDRALGFINFTTRETVLHPAPSGLIDELVVIADSRGQGIGRMLVQAAAEKCRELGCCELEVSTENSNTAARNFYKSVGFDEDSVLLEMDLDD